MAQTPLTRVFSKVRKVSFKFSAPPPPVLLHGGVKVSKTTMVTDIFAVHFFRVSRRDDVSSMSRHRRQLEVNDIDFSSLGRESYNVLFFLYELQSALLQCHDSFPGFDYMHLSLCVFM